MEKESFVVVVFLSIDNYFPFEVVYALVTLIINVT